jgi:YesN/AraC family two-component response regulator
MTITISIQHHTLTASVAAFIRERCRNGDVSSLTYASLTKKFAISETSLKVAFRRRYRQSIHAYVIKERTSYITELLESTNYSLSEIALKAGYNEPGNFSRDFTKKTGLSPTVYRQQLCQPRLAHTHNP